MELVSITGITKELVIYKAELYLGLSLAILRSPQCTLPAWRAHSSCSTSCLPGKTHLGAEDREDRKEKKREEEEGKEEGKKRKRIVLADEKPDLQISQGP